MVTNKNIVITGFMGTGKSTVAPLVAQALNRPFIETDAEIVHRTGLSIPAMFAQYGEAYFRQLERDLCQELSQATGYVIATGGGMLIPDENRQLMMETGLVVCLNAHVDDIATRLAQDSTRPLAATWRDLWAKRQAVYASLPYQIDTTNKEPHAISEEIIALWKTWPNVSP